MNAPLLSFGKLRFTYAGENTVWPFYAQFFQDAYGCLQINDGDTVLHTGASVGFFSIYAASRCRKVIAVEPGLEKFRAVTLHRAMNRPSNIKTVNRTVCSTPRYVKMASNSVVLSV